MTFSPYLAHTDPLLKSLEVLSIDKIFIDRIGLTMFKMNYDLIPKFHCHYLLEYIYFCTYIDCNYLLNKSPMLLVLNIQGY